MKQERLEKALEWVDRVVMIANDWEKHIAPRQNGRTAALAGMRLKALNIYKPIRYALTKAIKKPVRMDGSRARCPDCGAGIRMKTDNYCFRCGQRLAPVEKKPRYHGRAH